MSAEVVPLPVKEASLTPILNLTATAMNAVNAIILDRMQSEIPLIPALAGHLIAGGGKRIRGARSRGRRGDHGNAPVESPARSC